MSVIAYGLFRTRLGPSRAMLSRNWVAMRRAWVLVASGGVESLLFLFAFGFGVGALVGDITLPGGRTISYTAYVAPAILANAAMMGTLLETSINVFAKFKWMKVYDGVLATPMRPWDIALGEVWWALIRGGVYVAMFVIAMGAFGLLESVWSVLAVPAAVFIGLAFSGIGLTLATVFRNWPDFDWMMAIVFAMFLFGGTFTPVESYPGFAQPLVYAMPLYHGIELVRGISLGELGPMMAVNVLYLCALALAGTWIAQRRLAKALYK
ncbi:ABC transporter permease [Glycomyces xiaoerkulensis]|uniref:ABC transporter permease n=1 Tax=Glycomyces xiaoerkulensis TaxID=2038139 RepID=UPI000C255FDF|nr:ABC transporter permease [Glycomyces xiaoerkulensis]